MLNTRWSQCWRSAAALQACSRRFGTSAEATADQARRAALDNEALGDGNAVADCASESSPGPHSWDYQQRQDDSSSTQWERPDATAASRSIDRVLRESHAAQSASAGFFRGQGILGRRHGVDIDYFRDQEAAQLLAVQELLPRHHARPSLLAGALSAAGCALGVVSAAAPRGISLAVSGAVQDALSEHFNDQLRDLRDSGGADAAPDVRQTVVALRDAERAPDGAPVPPDLLTIQKMETMEDLGVGGAVGALVKAAARMALSATRRV